MDVWITTCRKKSKCAYCEQDIIKESHMVVGKYWRKINPAGESVAIRWTLKRRWHIECWVENGKIQADTVSAQRSDTRGRPRLVLSDNDRLMRNRLMVRRAVVVYRIRKVQEANPYDIDALVKLGSKLYDIKEKIGKYGGAPKSW